jgi:hypothetical protein
VADSIENPGRFISIPAISPFDTKKNVVELSDLFFLLKDIEGRRLLYDLYMAQENYIEALNQWNLRSAFHLEQLQPALAASGIANGTQVSDEVLRQCLGDQIYLQAINSTNNCIQMLQRAFERLAPLKTRLRAYLVCRFKTNDFTDFDFPDTWGLTDSYGASGTQDFRRI